MANDAPHVPRATYRVQFQAAFGFDAAAAIADYLEQLGVSHLYASPYLQAAAGSTHGYDVVDPRRVNEELGGAAAHARLCETLGRFHLGQVLDLVPNHMSIADRHNRWWWDVLENGQASRYAAFFDVDWQPPEAKLQNTVLLPILADHYGRIVEQREIALAREGGTFTLHYHDHVVPVAPRSLDNLLAVAAERCQSPLLSFLADAFGRLPLSTFVDQTSIARRHRDKEVLRELLDRLCREQPQVAAAIDGVIAEINVEPDAIDALVDRQNYRLAFWRTAGRELGYRRFFDINTLVSLRMESDNVFSETHAVVLDWLRQGVLDGLRIDHPDGLLDPEQYLGRLREAAPRAWIVVEKILQPAEHLPRSWPVAGTTGYDFLNRVNRLFVDPAAEQPLSEFYREFTGDSTDFAAIVHDKKLLVLQHMFGSDLNRLTSLLVQICEQHRRYRDYTRHEAHEALRETIACFPVYRSYVRSPAGQATDDDQRWVNQAIDEGKQRRGDLDADLFHFLRDLLLLHVRGDLEFELASRFQQLTGAVMAKGVEDTAFYCFNRLVSLNEVGGDPGRFGLSVEAFHTATLEVQQYWPNAMLATSTHDTKRSEDVRARINVLSEIPDRWSDAVRGWAAMNERHWNGYPPDRNAEYLLYQTLVGAWPLSPDRAAAYMEKACREAKVHTAWTNRDPVYEQAVRTFVEGILGDGAFCRDLAAFVEPLVEPGRINSLAQTLVKLTAPGVPDIYQGTELWNLSLVDPDNRRPVDYDLRRLLLAALPSCSIEQIWARQDEGLPKLCVIQRTLELRSRHPAPFAGSADYRPLQVLGGRADHLVAYARGGAADGEPPVEVIVAVPRLVLGVKGPWRDTRLAAGPGPWRNWFTNEVFAGEEIAAAELFRRFPVALLVKASPEVVLSPAP